MDPRQSPGLRGAGPAAARQRCPQCRLADVDLVHADLRDADLSGAKLQRANLSQAKLDGADLSGRLALHQPSGASERSHLRRNSTAQTYETRPRARFMPMPSSKPTSGATGLPARPRPCSTAQRWRHGRGKQPLESCEEPRRHRHPTLQQAGLPVDRGWQPAAMQTQLRRTLYGDGDSEKLKAQSSCCCTQGTHHEN